MRQVRDLRGTGGSHYRGHDRRKNAELKGQSLGPFVTAGSVIFVAVLGFALFPALTRATGMVDVDLVQVQLDAAGVAIALLVGVLCYVRWRVTGEAPALWFAAGMLFFGAVTVGLGKVVPQVQPVGLDHEFIDWMLPASRLAVLWLLFQGLRTPPVDTRWRLPTVLLAAVGVTAVIATLFQIFPPLLTVFGSAGDAIVIQAADISMGAVILVFGWVALGSIAGFRGLRMRRWLFAWFGLLFFALAFAEVLRTAGYPDGSIWLAGPSALRLLGLLCAIVGATRELVRAFEQQQLRLLETVKSEQTNHARLEAEKRALEELAHEARNALASIEGATRTLERHHDRLDPNTRAGLAEAVSEEIARLQRLVSADRMRSAPQYFQLIDAVRASATAARTRGVTVYVDVPSDLVAFGRLSETAQVVQNLVENARRYAPGSPVYIRAEAVDGNVRLRVEDEGPGVPREERDAIFERGRRGAATHAAGGTGLGLYVSTRLMHEQGGDLWVDERIGGGASFALQLPAQAPSAALTDEVGDQFEHAGEIADVAPLFGLGRAHDADGAQARRRAQDEDDLREHTGR